MKTLFEDRMLEVRRRIKEIAAETKAQVRIVQTGNHLTPEPEGEQHKAAEDRGEMIANLMLAYRHLEDASMRIGKAIQASNGDSTVGA